MQEQRTQSFPWRLFGYELAGTAVLTVAKLYYLDTDRDGLFRRMGSLNPAGCATISIN